MGSLFGTLPRNTYSINTFVYSILKSIEFSCLSENDKDLTPDNETIKSLETLLMEKNRYLQSENTSLKCKNKEIQGIFFNFILFIRLTIY